MAETIKILKGKPFPMGISLCGNDVNIAVSASNKEPLKLVLYKNGNERIVCDIPAECLVGDVYGILLKNFDYSKYQYTFLDGKEEFCDPFASKVAGCDKWGIRNPKACFYFPDVIEFDKRLCISYDESILYQLHVRGFSKHSSSKVKYKGCFEGVVEKIPYFKELGINGIEFMPVYDFDEIIKEKPLPYYKDLTANKEEKSRINYWGFCDGFYFAPKAAYSGIKDAPVSFRNMVDALHKSGIEVILQFYFKDSVSIFTIMQCLRYWRYNYNVDGFHLMGSGIDFSLVAKEPMFSDTKLFLENVELDKINPSNLTKPYINIASYRDEYMYDARKYLKGDEDMLGRMSKHFTDVPYDMGRVNYITNYYGFTLNDLVSYERKHNEDNGEDNKDGNDYNFSWNCGFEGPTKKKSVVSLRQRLCKNAMMFMLLSAGTPLLRSGDEFLNSQKGNNNAYCQDNVISYINWNDCDKNKEFFEFVKELIEFRKNHTIIHPKKAFRMMDNESKGFPDLSMHGEQAYYPQFENYNRHIGLLYNGAYAKSVEPSLFVLYNMYWNEKSFALPKTSIDKHWEVLFTSDTALAKRDASYEGSDFIKLPGRCFGILVEKENVKKQNTTVIKDAIEKGVRKIRSNRNRK